ncbi:2-haloacid dehalogenase [Amycolatopsis bartoniae]|uniref:Haloacid dehalogenase n=1 Tax=Amycolatopsis bartoniae TaxID=941986 RepID=A0A8H9IRC4_9PSEU|nr:haloacid dehalogenase type II [Amycolatopsis bartoniae]MBB2937047.1 2-haloacid dehalogenase [Amycolatopsis bartoniae]TVT01050.1 haloacid dehalogenase type II [Amycolatopsis bartoniae]GHF52059.1 haloacid dehalogenase [Amycolatopsis bartoniae]
MTIRVLAFDIFGTTVDWYTGVSRQVGEVFGELGVRLDAGIFASEWRDKYLPSMARVQHGERDWAYLDTLHRESLDDLLDDHGVGEQVDEAARQRLVHAWHRLPAWDDVPGGLRRLREGHVLAALSNGGFALMTNLVKAANLPFDCILSAELARTYKPDARVYRTAAELLDVAPEEVLMVAAHGWDLKGAAEAGLRTAFVERPREKGPDREADKDVEAEFSVRGFPELAEKLGV